MTRRILLALHLVGLASFLLALSALGRIYLETQTPFWIMRSAKAHVPDGLGQGAGGLHLPVVFKDWSRIDRTGEALLISEVMYDPLGAEPGSEWIELFNPSSQVVELTHVKVGDEETADGG